MSDQMQSAHIDAGEKVRTNQGMTKYLIQNSEGANIMIRYFGPETDIRVHSHPYDEMWYVLEGEFEVGDAVYGAGSVVYIPADVPYGPTRSPQGASLLRYAGGPDRR